MCAHEAAKIKLLTIGKENRKTGVETGLAFLGGEGLEKRSESEAKSAIATANCRCRRCCTDTGNIIRIASEERWAGIEAAKALWIVLFSEGKEWVALGGSGWSTGQSAKAAKWILKYKFKWQIDKWTFWAFYVFIVCLYLSARFAFVRRRARGWGGTGALKNPGKLRANVARLWVKIVWN